MTQTKPSLSKHCGEVLEQQIKKRGITREVAADGLSVDLRTLRRWIHEGIDSLDTLEKIAEYFEIDVLTFFR